MNNPEDKKMNSYRSTLTTLALTGCLLFAAYGCKKGGPATPYDAKLPDTTGDLVVKVIDKTVPVAGVTIQVLDPMGNTTTSTTDPYGQVSLPINYKRYYQEQPDPIYYINLPQQLIYATSTGSINPTNGTNVFTFDSGNLSSLNPVAQGPTSYTQNLQSTVIYNLQYTPGGNLQVPVTVSVDHVPSGWTAAYQNNFLGSSVFNTGVTITVPPNSFKQPGLVFKGIDSAGITYAASNSTTILRGFQIGIWVVSTVSFGPSTPNVPGKSSITGSFGFGLSNAGSSSWSLTYCVDTVANGCGFEAYSGSFGGAGTGSIGWSRNSEITGLPLYVSFTASNPDIGTYSGSFQLSTIGVAASHTSPTSIY